MWSWLKLKILEWKLKGVFGGYNRYRCWCMKRGAKTVREKLLVAKDALDTPGANSLEAQYNESYLKHLD